jgi:hypothetical protein
MSIGSAKENAMSVKTLNLDRIPSPIMNGKEQKVSA